MAGDGVRLAVLIDADNTSPKYAEALLAEIAKYGTAHARRAYGDWTGTSLKGWKEQLLEQSIQPIQQFAYTVGKNATDSAMVIDAMDLLYSDRFDGFCIVSSDSDFTRLAARIRESGLIVYGFGARKTPKPFVAACDKFVYIENLADEASDAPDAEAESGPTPPTARSAPPEATPVALLRRAVEAASDDDGWANLGGVGSILTKRKPDFDSRTYGFAKLGDLFEASSAFEVERRNSGAGRNTNVYVRARARARK